MVHACFVRSAHAHGHQGIDVGGSPCAAGRRSPVRPPRSRCRRQADAAVRSLAADAQKPAPMHVIAAEPCIRGRHDRRSRRRTRRERSKRGRASMVGSTTSRSARRRSRSRDPDAARRQAPPNAGAPDNAPLRCARISATSNKVSSLRAPAHVFARHRQPAAATRDGMPRRDRRRRYDLAAS